MPDKEEIPGLGIELSAIFDTLPEEQRVHFRTETSRLIHDMRQAISIIFTAEKLLRADAKMPTEDFELLDAIDTASKRAMGILTDFARPFDTGKTLPLKRQPVKLDDK